MTKRLTFLPLLAIGALLVAACSTTGATASPSVASVAPSVAPSASASEEPSASSSDAAEEPYKLEAASGTVGPYLTGEDGKTLYTFKPDVADSGKSTCNGDCAVNWPPFVVDSADEVEAGDGVSGKISLVTRDDGTMQVAYNGKPVYYFKNDTKAGDTNGQGLADKWFVAAP
jgi:predicted lipoprotein with Yx(FWY)xxD motif